MLYDDRGYTGEIYDPDSLTRFGSIDYYRDKIREFQQSLDALDSAAVQVRELAQLPLPPAEYDEALSWLMDYESRRELAIGAATAINGASEVANALGVRMPKMSWGQSALAGVGNPAALAAIGAAVAGAAWFLSYAVEKITSAKAIASRVAVIESLTGAERAEALKREQEIELAEKRALSPVAAVADTVKWIAIGAAVFFAIRAFREFQASR